MGIVRLMVDAPDAVAVTPLPSASGVVYKVVVAKNDQGKLISQGGRIARSLRIMLLAMSRKAGIEMSLDIVS